MNLFKVILFATALCVAGTAAFFSVKGIGTLFSGAVIAAMVMAGVLELGKVIATSYLYRYWKTTSTILKAYLMFAIAALVFITSIGIFGYLTAAYQQSSIQAKLAEQRIEIIAVEKQVYFDAMTSQKDRVASLVTIRREQEDRLSKGPPAAEKRSTEQLRKWNEQQISLIDQTTLEIDKIQKDISSIADKVRDKDIEILNAKLENSGKKDIVTFQFLADAIGWKLDNVVKWFVLLIVIVFDPLAVCLILSYNISKYNKSDFDSETISENLQKNVESDKKSEKTIVKQEENAPPATIPMTEPVDIPLNTETVDTEHDKEPVEKVSKRGFSLYKKNKAHNQKNI